MTNRSKGHRDQSQHFLCDFCLCPREDRAHAFFTCIRVAQFWEQIQDFITSLDFFHPFHLNNFETVVAGTTFFEGPAQLKKIFAILHSEALETIWKARDSNTANLYEKWKSTIRAHVLSKLLYHGDPEIWKFCNRICFKQNGKCLITPLLNFKLKE